MSFKKKIPRDFPGGPVVRFPHFQCRGCGFDPGRNLDFTCYTVMNLDSTCYTVDYDVYNSMQFYPTHIHISIMMQNIELFHHYKGNPHATPLLSNSLPCPPGNYCLVFHLLSFVLLKVLYKWDCYSVLPCEIIFVFKCDSFKIHPSFSPYL